MNHSFRFVPFLSSLALAAGAEAHHSLWGVYDSTRMVTIEGVVTAFQFVHPHPFLMVDVPDETGTPQTWRLELDNLNELDEAGVTNGTFQRGDRVVVLGNVALRQPRRLYLRRLDRPADGLRLEQVRTMPILHPPARPADDPAVEP